MWISLSVAETVARAKSGSQVANSSELRLYFESGKVSEWWLLHNSTSEDGYNSKVEIWRHYEGKYKVHSYMLVPKH